MIYPSGGHYRRIPASMSKSSSVPKIVSEYAKLSQERRKVEEKLDLAKPAAIRQVMSSQLFVRGAPFMETKYGVLVCATKTKVILDDASKKKVDELKQAIKRVEDRAVATGKAELVTSQYLSLR